MHELSNQLHEMSDRQSATLKPVVFPKLIFKSVVVEFSKQFATETML